LLWAGQELGLLLAVMMMIYLLALLASSRVVYGSFLASVRAAARNRRMMHDFAQAEREWLEISDSAEAFALLDGERRLLLWNDGFRRLWSEGTALRRGESYRDVLARHPGSSAVAAGSQSRADWLAA
jgi:hypothetical protein